MKEQYAVGHRAVAPIKSNNCHFKTKCTIRIFNQQYEACNYSKVIRPRRVNVEFLIDDSVDDVIRKFCVGMSEETIKDDFQYLILLHACGQNLPEYKDYLDVPEGWYVTKKFESNLFKRIYGKYKGLVVV